ncbi:MAG: sulfotransferase [Acidimicrobiaceae bacterium]|nr:sulfotransferase [Acidimicrobiaceae bacterium]
MQKAPIKVLYILGFGRSGSTLLDLLLGGIDGFFSTGELQSLWQESLIDGRLCGCGVPVADCKLWSEILGGRDGTHLGMTPEELAALQDERLHFPALGPRFRTAGRSEADWSAFAGAFDTLYRRIAAVTEARVIVDSSKLPTATRALRRLDSIELYYLQLVRDARAVAFSWLRTKEAIDRTRLGQMERLGVMRSTATWVARQLAAERTRASTATPSMLVRYEDLVANPAATVARVAAMVGEPGPDLSFIDGQAVRLDVNHTVSGNPVRLQEGTLHIREDTEWQAGLPRSARLAVTGMAAPLLKRYGYL